MKAVILLIDLFLLVFACSCNKIVYKTNGETIYMTGRNVNGEKLLNKSASRIKIANSCKTCHGKSGDAMKDISIKFSFLSNPNNFPRPYDDSLFFRFLDRDLKTNGTKANIGVIWRMSDKDKKDLFDFLKSL